MEDDPKRKGMRKRKPKAKPSKAEDRKPRKRTAVDASKIGLGGILAPGTDGRRVLLNMVTMGFEIPTAAEAIGITKQAVHYQMDQEEINPTIPPESKLRYLVATSRATIKRIAGSKLNSLIAAGNFRAIKFYLERRTEEFKPPERSISVRLPEERATEARSALIALIAATDGKFGDEEAANRVGSKGDEDVDFG